MPRTLALLLTLAGSLLVAPATAVPVPVSPGQAEPDALPGLSDSALRTIVDQFRRHGVADAPAKPDGAIRLTTYNIHDLYDEHDDPALAGRNDDRERTMIPSRRAATRLALRAIDADILALQEVESLDAARWYRDLALEGMGYEHIATEEVGHSLGMQQAVLSRFPILETRTFADRVIGEHPPLYRGRPNRYAGQPMTFRRSPLLVEVALTDGTPAADLAEGDRLTVLVVHAKTGEGSEAWRLAEGQALAAIVGELRSERPERRIVIAGDFAMPRGEGHLAPVLGAGFTDAFEGVQAPAKDLATNIDGERACHILLGPGVAAAEGATPFVLGTVVPPEQLDRRTAYTMPGFASDHYPVTVDLAR